MREDEQEESERDPKPADLNEIDVEDVAFAREVAWCLLGMVGL